MFENPWLVLLVFGAVGIWSNVVYSLIYRIFKPRKRYQYGMPLKVTVSIFFCCGLLLSYFGSIKLHDYMVKKSYPTTEGFVLSSDIRSINTMFIPVVEYRYVVGKDTLQKKQELYSPQFGLKDNRKANSYNALNPFFIGKKIMVYYNPENPSEASVENILSWDVIIRFGTGIMLWVMATFALMDRVLIRRIGV